MFRKAQDHQITMDGGVNSPPISVAGFAWSAIHFGADIPATTITYQILNEDQSGTDEASFVFTDAVDTDGAAIGTINVTPGMVFTDVSDGELFTGVSFGVWRGTTSGQYIHDHSKDVMQKPVHEVLTYDQVHGALSPLLPAMPEMSKVEIQVKATGIHFNWVEIVEEQKAASTVPAPVEPTKTETEQTTQ